MLSKHGRKIDGFDFETKTKYKFIKFSQEITPFVYAPNGTDKGTGYAVDLEQPFCINAGLFNPREGQYEPEGIIIQNGVVLQNKSAVFYPDSMPLTIDKNGKLWYADANADAYELVTQGCVSAVCGFMPIIIDGESVPEEKWTRVPHYNIPCQRQIIGQFENGDYAVITCEGRGYDDSIGWTIHDAQRICLKYGLWFAYNLDGGTSTETVFEGKQINSRYERPAGRFVSTFIVFQEKGGIL